MDVLRSLFFLGRRGRRSWGAICIFCICRMRKSTIALGMLRLCVWPRLLTGFDRYRCTSLVSHETPCCCKPALKSLSLLSDQTNKHFAFYICHHRFMMSNPNCTNISPQKTLFWRGNLPKWYLWLCEKPYLREGNGRFWTSKNPISGETYGGASRGLFRSYVNFASFHWAQQKCLSTGLRIP